MVDLLVDVHRSEGLIDLQKGQMNDEAYQQSIMWYAQHLKLFVRVYSHVEERLNEEYDVWNLLVADSKDFDVSEAGDSVELWTLRDYLVLDQDRRTSYRLWEIQTDSNYVAGDTLRWSFEVSKLTKGQKLLASMSLRPREKDFENATNKYRDYMMKRPVGAQALLVEADGARQFQVVPDSAKAFGSVILNLTLISPDTVQSPTFLRNISLKRYHRK